MTNPVYKKMRLQGKKIKMVRIEYQQYFETWKIEKICEMV